MTLSKKLYEINNKLRDTLYESRKNINKDEDENYTTFKTLSLEQTYINLDALYRIAEEITSARQDLRKVCHDLEFLRKYLNYIFEHKIKLEKTAIDKLDETIKKMEE